MFVVDIILRNGVDLPEEQILDLMTKYDLRENGTFAYVEFLRHFILHLKQQDETSLLTRRKLPGAKLAVSTYIKL